EVPIPSHWLLRSAAPTRSAERVEVVSMTDWIAQQDYIRAYGERGGIDRWLAEAVTREKERARLGVPGCHALTNPAQWRTELRTAERYFERVYGTPQPALSTWRRSQPKPAATRTKPAGRATKPPAKRSRVAPAQPPVELRMPGERWWEYPRRPTG